MRHIHKLIPFLLGMFCFAGLQAQIDSNLTLLGRWDNNALPSNSGITFNDIWGWADTTSGREYAIMGSLGFTYFIDITDPSNPVVRDSVAGGYNNCIHRDFKTYGNFCYGVADQGNTQSSLQVIDMSYLPDSVHLVYDSDTFFNRSHNIFIDEPGGRLYAVGTYPSNKRCVVLDLATNPANPTLLSDINLGVYAHDIFVENDTAFLSCGNNGLFVYDYSNPTNPVQIGLLNTYPQKGYTHACWRTEDGNHLVLADETHNTALKMVDISNLNNMNVVALFRSKLLAPADTASIPHNPFMAGNYAVVSYYHDGVQIWDVSNPAAPVKKAWYDTDTVSTTYSGFKGCWGVYPYLPSGTIIASDIDEGLFTFRTAFPFPYDLNSQLGVVHVDCHGAMNGSISASVTGGTPPYSFLWSNGDTLETATGLGPGTWMVTISDRYGNQIQDSAVVNEPTAIQSALSVQDETCSGVQDGSIDLTAGGGTGSLSYLWSTGDTTEDLAGLGPGSYSVTLTDANGCQHNDTATVVATTVQPVADAGMDQDICSLPASLSALPPNVGTGTWIELGAGGTVASPNDPHSQLAGLAAGNTYTYRWSIVNGPCTADDTVSVSVYGTILTDAGPDQSICGDSASLQAQLPPQGGGTWSVFVGSGSISAPNATNTAVTALDRGINRFIWTVTDGPCTRRDTVEIETEFYPLAAFGYQVNQSTVSFSDSSLYAASWDWDFGDGSSGSLTQPSHIYPDGNWTACLTVSNSCGNDSACANFTISTVGLEGPEGHSWHIGPVPADQFLLIRGDFRQRTEWSLFNALGQEMMSRTLRASSRDTETIDLQEIPEGIYLLRIHSKNAGNAVFRVQISRK